MGQNDPMQASHSAAMESIHGAFENDPRLGSPNVPPIPESGVYQNDPMQASHSAAMEPIHGTFENEPTLVEFSLAMVSGHGEYESEPRRVEHSPVMVPGHGEYESAPSVSNATARHTLPKRSTERDPTGRPLPLTAMAVEYQEWIKP